MKSNVCNVKAMVATGAGTKMVTGKTNMPSQYNRITDYASAAPDNGIVIFDARGFGEDNTVFFINWRYVIFITPQDNN